MRLLRYLALSSVAVSSPLVAQDADSLALASAYKVDFDNQDLQVVLSTLAQAADVNITFSRLPKIRTTLHLGQPVPKEELVDVMREIVEGNGLAMMQTGSLIRIGQPEDSEESRSDADMGSPPEVRIYTYRVKHNDAVELAPVLANLLGGTSGPGRSTSNQRRASTRSRGANTTQPTRRNSAPSTSSRNRSTAGGGAPDPRSHIRIVAEPYTNSLLVRATAEEWELLKKIIEDVD